MSCTYAANGLPFLSPWAITNGAAQTQIDDRFNWLRASINVPPRKFQRVVSEVLTLQNSAEVPRVRLAASALMLGYNN
jgi:hypothetical protein